ncbi:MAG TPA: MerR family transcriptional regulator [Candidatus Dormibacteraeota bacterium]|nr:MerR family transcriptional regulator [Candidatus Dormibacteraeota bacterium]
MKGFPYRMRDLVRLTGTPAPTVHFWLQQGLLPAAQKTAGNQALYSEGTVARLLWIRALQHEMHLPLRSIRWVLERHGELPIAEINALQALGSLLEEPDPVASADQLAAVSEQASAVDLAGLRRLGLIAQDGAISTSDLRIIELTAAMRQAGFTEDAGFSIENMALYRDAVEQLVQEELARIIEPVLDRHDPATLRDLVNRGFPLANQLLALLHHKVLQAELQRWLPEPGASESATA